MFRSPCTMRPAHWGHFTWDGIFALASDFPHARTCTDDVVVTDADLEKRREALWALLTALEVLLPCADCKEHFHSHMDTLRREDKKNAVLRDRDSLLKWLYDVKHDVNCRTGRTSPSFDDVEAKWVPACRSLPNEQRAASAQTGRAVAAVASEQRTAPAPVIDAVFTSAFARTRHAGTQGDE